MCTTSWAATTDGYVLWFNRDERRERPPARPPRVWRGAGTPFVAPVDGLAGGTWLAVNARGVTVCLLNLYLGPPAAWPPAPDRPRPPSRGHLVADLAALPDVASIMSALPPERAAVFAPFTLVALDPRGRPTRADWDGARLQWRRGADVDPFVSSSGFDPDRVLEARAAAFGRAHAAARDGDARDWREDFQRGHDPARGPLSVCMHRPEARTVSLSQVTVGAASVALRYGEGPACGAVLGPPVALARARDAA